MTQLKLYTLDKKHYILLSVSEGSASPDQISTFSIYPGIKALYCIKHSILGRVTNPNNHGAGRIIIVSYFVFINVMYYYF